MKKIILLCLSLSFLANADTIKVIQAGKSFLPGMSEEKLNEAKNSRGKYIKQSIKKVKITELEIKKGDTIEFHNKDNVVHNVFGKGFSFNQEKDSVTKKTFEETGTRIIRCAIHPKMKLKVTVKDSKAK